MKIFKIFLWALAFIVVIIGLGLLIATWAGQTQFKIPAYAMVICASLIFIVIFIMDFMNTMVYKETAGDEYNFISKKKAMELLDKAGIKYEEGQHKDYYITLLRLNNKKGEE